MSTKLNPKPSRRDRPKSSGQLINVTLQHKHIKLANDPVSRHNIFSTSSTASGIFLAFLGKVPRGLLAWEFYGVLQQIGKISVSRYGTVTQRH